jgi:hypothetical protein
MKHRTHVVSSILSGALLLALVSSPGVSWAGEKATKKTAATAEAKKNPAVPAAQSAPSNEEEMAAMMKMAMPGPEHAALNPLAGIWKITTKMWSAPGEPQVMEGTCERNWVMDGRYLVGNYRGSYAGMPFEGMEALGYDHFKKQYVSSWVDNAGTGIMLSRGEPMDPTTKSLTLTGSSPDMKGKETLMRLVTSIVDGNTASMTMYSTQDGQEMRTMEITYTRVK